MKLHRRVFFFFPGNRVRICLSNGRCNGNVQKNDCAPRCSVSFVTLYFNSDISEGVKMVHLEFWLFLTDITIICRNFCIMIIPNLLLLNDC